MGRMTKELIYRFQNLDNLHIKTLLLSNLVEDTDETSAIFNKEFPSDRQNIPTKQELREKHPINLALCYAPTAVCDRLVDAMLAVKPTELLRLLSQVDKDNTDKDTEDSVLFTFMNHAPTGVRLKIAEKIKTLSEKKIITLLFCSKTSKPNFKHFIKLINVSDPQSAICLIEALDKIDKNTLFNLFQTGVFPGFIELFKKNPPDELALAILKLLDRCNLENLHKLIYSRNQNLLHAVLHTQSEVILDELLVVLRKARIEDVKSYLSQKDTESKRTPVELAFARKDKPRVGLILAQTLNSHSELKPLLTAVSAFQPYSPMQYAAANNNIPVTAYLLEQGLPIEHLSYSSRKTMLDRAKKNGNQDIVTLFNALPIYRLIQEYSADSYKKLPTVGINKIIKKDPNILSCRWSDQKTLLHLAIKQRFTELAIHLHKNGASPSSKDLDGNTPIDEALQTNQLQILKTFTRTKASTNNLTIIAFAESLTKIKNPKQSYEALEKVLKTVQQPTAIQDYCHERNDCYIFFLTEIGRLLALAKNEQLDSAVKAFLEANLEKLHNDKNHIKSGARQLQLLILIFSIPEKERFALLRSLNLSEGAKTQLGLVLSRGLVQPAIYNNLSPAEHYQSYQFIKQLFPGDSTLIQSIATIHFQSPNLVLLPPDVLKELASVSSCESMLLSTKQRINPLLIVLTLEKLLKTIPLDNENVALLSGQLKREVQLFNSETSIYSDEQLQDLLNLVSEPTLKQFIRNTILELDDSTVIKKRLGKLFNSYDKKRGLMPDSLLTELFLEYATSSDLVNHPENYGIIAEILAVVSPTKVTEILQSLQNTLLPHLKVNAMFTAVLAESKDEHLPDWFYRLDNKNQRFALATLIDQAEHFRAKARQFAEALSKAEYFSVFNGLQNLALCLDVVSSQLFQVHLDQDGSAWSDSLETNLHNLNLAFDELMGSLKDSTQKANFKIEYPDLVSELEKLQASKTIALLCNTIASSCKKIDNDQLERDQTLTALSKENKLAKHLVSSAQQEQTLASEQLPVLAELASERSMLLKQQVNKLNQQVLQGLVQNPQQEQLVSQLFNWILYCGHNLSIETKFGQLSTLIETASPHDWSTVDQQINTLLALRNDVAPLLFDLQIIGLSNTTSMDDLLATLYNADDLMLIQLIELSSRTQLHDFRCLINYVLSAKKQQVPLDLLKLQPLQIRSSNLANWIQANLEALESYPSQAMTFKILREGTYQSDQDSKARLLAFNEIIEENIATPHPNAINLFISSYFPILKGKNTSLESRAFILSLSNLLRHSKLHTINAVICQIAPEILDLIINYCLLGLNSDDKAYDQACRYLLSNFCQTQFASNSTSLNLIKSRLGQQDLALLGDERLIDIAENILSETDSSLFGHTLNGVWIQRLLTSPRFVAASNPKALQALSDRYRLISLTLKQAEFEQLNNWIQGKLAFYSHHHKSMEQLEHSIAQNSLQRDHLLKKRERLLAFRADDSIRALFNQLEEACFELQLSCPEQAESALAVLYTHYNNSLTSLRSDLLFKVADFIISRASRDQGDLASAQSTLMTWLKHYLPSKNFEQLELARKQDVLIYNDKRQQIGFITESNHAMTFVNDEPCSLLELPGIQPGLPLYDSERGLIGTLTSSGEIKRENLFQKNTSALLVATVPTAQLDKSAAALDLLINDIFTESSLEQVYVNSESDKHPWIAQHVNQRLAESCKPLSQENLLAVIKHHPSDSVFSLLAEIKHHENAEQLFETILADESKRKELFSQERRKFAFDFFGRHDSTLLFANFLVSHKDKPWLNEGLQLFADFAQKSDKPDLLTKALINLNEKTYTKKCLAEQDYNTVLTNLINNEACASIVWGSFLKATNLTKIQQIDPSLSNDLMSLFHKHHCIPTIKSLHEQKNWTQSNQYRLILLILDKQREKLFQPNELRLSEKAAWSGAELQQISTFLKRHLRQKTMLDENNAIGKKLLGELVFRCANFGQTHLFYNQGNFDPLVATQMLERSYLDAIMARDYLPTELRKKIEGVISSVRGWFDKKHKDNLEITELLKENQAIIDWRELSNETWHMNDSMTSMPLISAYLINYSGPKAPLVKLIKDYILNVQLKDNPRYLHHASQVMVKLPNRDVGTCLFTSFEELVLNDPAILDRKLFAHMAQFHAHRHLGKELKSPHAEIHLIKHFGLQKKYDLVRQCCNLLKIEKHDSKTTKLLNKISTEARVESQLSKHLTSWYYPLLQFFKRLWNYGFDGENEASNMVSFCDKEITYSPRTASPDIIRTPTPSGQTSANQLEVAKKTMALRERYTNFIKQQDNITVVAGSKNELPEMLVSPGKLSVFHHVNTEEVPQNSLFEAFEERQVAIIAN